MLVRTSLRRATDSDYRAFYGKAPPDDWVGWIAERQGQLVAFGYIWIDHLARAWTGIDNAREVPPVMLHRAIADIYAAMRDEGIPVLHALCDERIPAATRWLARLGFAIDEDMPKMYMPVVDKFLPVWKRVL